MRKNKNGFTLVELSIVLVIIGLLIGGILVGQSLITSAKIGRMVRELQQYEILASQFKGRYKYWPGDVPNGYDLFGATCGTNSTAAGGCNGDGNGSLMSANFGESSNFWAQLSHAGYLGDKRFTANNPYWITPGDGSLTMPYYDKIIMWPANFWYQVYGVAASTKNSMNLGLSFVGEARPDMMPADAMSLDAKIDDGLAGKGIVVGRNAATKICTDTSNITNVNSIYNVTTGTGCMLTIYAFQDYPVILP